MALTLEEMTLQPAQLADFAPLARRAVEVDPASMIRFRTAAEGTLVSAFVRLPFGALAGRTIVVPDAQAGAGTDSVVSAAGFLGWLDGQAAPGDRSASWLEPLPPRQGWRRVDFVPADAVYDVVTKGRDLAGSVEERRRQQSLLDSIALTVSDSSTTVEIPLSALGAVTSMGFLPPDGQLAVDTAPGWSRLAAPLGSTYVATGRGVLSLLG